MVGSFDLAVNLYSGMRVDPPAGDFITRNAMDEQHIAVGWWPGDPRYHAPRSTGTRPAPEGYGTVAVEPSAAKWVEELGEFILDWDDARAEPGAHATALAFARGVVLHGCVACEWDPALEPASSPSPRPSPDPAAGSRNCGEPQRTSANDGLVNGDRADARIAR